MSFDQKIFSTVYDLYQKIKRKPLDANLKNKANLSDLLPRLRIIANGVAGSPIAIYPVRHGYGHTHEKSLILPLEIAWFEDTALNESIYLCRTAYSALVIREKAQTLDNILESEFPGLYRSLAILDQEAEKTSSITKKLGRAQWLALSRGTIPTAFTEENQTNEIPVLELEPSSPQKNGTVENDRPTLAKIKVIDTENVNPMVHVFEKAITADDYQGGSRDIDSNSENSSIALSELNVEQVVKALGETGSLYRGGLRLSEDALTKEPLQEKDTGPNIFFYPEWSRRKLSFLKNWCTIYEERVPAPERHQRTILSSTVLKESKALTLELERFVNKPLWLRNQQDGPELDLDAVVRFKSDLKAGSSPQKNLYIERLKTEQDLALLILADVSLSTDGWISNQRVFDTIQESLQILTATFQNVQQKVSLAAFFSNTRNHCTYLNVKGFDETWDLVPEKIQNLKPQGYTRMGPAIRHATHLLRNQRAIKKLLIIISDAKPTDYDAYEGTHGESDVQHAVLEARTKQITVKGFAISTPKAGHVKRIYGQSGFETFTDVRGLSKHLIQAYMEVLDR